MHEVDAPKMKDGRWVDAAPCPKLCRAWCEVLDKQSRRQKVQRNCCSWPNEVETALVFHARKERRSSE